ncbi:MAG: hypothetical protein ACKVPX_09740 [Myxococcaceae bacterium]
MRSRPVPSGDGNVAFVDAINEGTRRTFNCAVKRQTGLPEHYKSLAEPQHANLCARLPSVFAAEGDWVVMERIRGADNDALVALFDNPGFARRFAAQAAGLVVASAASGFVLQDVIFCLGHNCIVEKNTRCLRLIELDAMRPLNLPRGELVGAALQSELDFCGEAPDPHRLAFGLEFARRILRRVSAESIVTRAEYWTHAATGKAPCIKPMADLTSSLVPTPEFLSAVHENDARRFARVLTAGAGFRAVVDRDDPRSWVLFSSDGKNPRLVPPFTARASGDTWTSR